LDYIEGRGVKRESCSKGMMLKNNIEGRIRAHEMSEDDARSKVGKRRFLERGSLRRV